MALIKRLEEKAKNCFDERNYYEALQIYLTIHPRLKAQKKYAALADFLYGGAVNMVDVGEFASALNLGELFIDTLTVSKAPVTEELLDRFDQLFKRIPAVLPDEGESRVDRRSDLLTAALKWTQAVATTRNEAKYGSCLLHRRIALTLWEGGNFMDAKKHFLLSNDSENFAAGLIEFQMNVECEDEADLVGTKAVLELLCYRRSASAYQLLKLYAQNHPEIKASAPFKSQPLFTFCWLLILCLQLRRTTANEIVIAYFTELIAYFKPHLDRDPSLMLCLDKIGQVYLKVKSPRTEGGLLGSLFRGFMGAPQPQDNEENSLIDDTSANEFDANIDEAAFLNSAQSVGISIPTLSDSMRRLSPEEKKPKKAEPATVTVAHSDMDLD